MTQIWMDGFDHYGGDAALLTDGPYAETVTPGTATTSPTRLYAPGAGARTGAYALRLRNGGMTRRVLGVEHDQLFCGFGLFFDNLPSASNTHAAFQVRDTGNNVLATMGVRSDGGLDFRDGDITATILGTTTGTAIVAGTWNFIELKILRHASAGTFEIRVDGAAVLTLTSLALGALDYAQWSARVTTGTNIDMYIDDLIIRDELGTVNNGFEGDLRVATLNPIANGVNQGWATRAIQKLGAGVIDFLDTTTPNEALAYSDLAAYELGSGEFCMEGFVRISNDIVAAETATIFSKWRESTNERSWRLILQGASAGGALVWETSVLGTSGDIVQVSFDFTSTFITDRWFHFAVTREGTTLRIFVDGVLVGTAADSRTYYNGTAALFINGGQNTPTTANASESIDGWMDGVRLTVGAARYTANFFPPTAELPTDVGGDSLYNSVELLLNFDDVSNPDDSSNAASGTLIGGAAVIFPDDDEAFQTIQSLTPEDNDFVEASLVAATQTLTLTGQPLNTETVTLSANTYTFQTTLTDVAGNVLIGATASDSLDNLRAAINLETGSGTTYAASTVAHPTIFATDLSGDLLLMTARTPGTAGNSLATTETLTNGSFGAATLLGGLDIPANSEFTVSALPSDTTGVRSAAIVTRSMKTNAGAAGLTSSLVMVGGASAAGSENLMTVNPTYYEDTFEVDPNTSGNLTPSSITGSRIRLDRTT